ncbi:NUDIX hydrolase [Patescibacteria group bacterium]|nr:NUDIX hydrolase [Patescibacteria group bacterium]MBU4347294.1 NUDIX hydrolase [Patescibacteria group bacterium]MBU4455352.1 NUDIX hydrolase [Patescibacteria group bacterium]MCG2690878.1 NUDIX hydrolase [Candidatus Parcubacteria bacterium]
MTKIIIASGPVIVENGKVLLNKHGDTAFWKFCGGRVEDFSTDLIDNAKREVKEEMGIGINILNEEPFITFTRKETSEETIDIILVHFLAERIGEIKQGEDIREWKWVDINNLPEDLGPNIIPALKHFGFLK